MHKVLESVDADAPLVALMVWINMLPEDESADLPALLESLADPHARWFRDPQRRLGQVVATALGAPGQTAWDVYIAFDADAHWSKAMPRPRDWVHQLSDRWADPSRLQARDALEPALARMVTDLLAH